MNPARYLSILPLTLFLQASVDANEPVLSITPDKCVALRKGQTCYQTLNVNFIASENGDYCLRISNQTTPLQCWQGVSSLNYQYRLASKSDVEFEIIDEQQSIVASSSVTIAWVYKKSRARSRWRLF
jgi:hypothetical protein